MSNDVYSQSGLKQKQSSLNKSINNNENKKKPQKLIKLQLSTVNFNIQNSINIPSADVNRLFENEEKSNKFNNKEKEGKEGKANSTTNDDLYIKISKSRNNSGKGMERIKSKNLIETVLLNNNFNKGNRVSSFITKSIERSVSNITNLNNTNQINEGNKEEKEYIKIPKKHLNNSSSQSNIPNLSNVKYNIINKNKQMKTFINSNLLVPNDKSSSKNTNHIETVNKENESGLNILTSSKKEQSNSKIQLKNELSHVDDRINIGNQDNNTQYINSQESLNSKGSLGLNLLKKKIKNAILNKTQKYNLNNKSDLTNNIIKPHNKAINNPIESFPSGILKNYSLFMNISKKNIKNEESSLERTDEMNKSIQSKEKKSVKEILSSCSSQSNFNKRKKEILSKRLNHNLNLNEGYTSKMNSLNNSIIQTESIIMKEDHHSQIVDLSIEKGEFKNTFKSSKFNISNNTKINYKANESNAKEENLNIKKKYFFSKDYKSKYKQTKTEINRLNNEIINQGEDNKRLIEELKKSQFMTNFLKEYINNYKKESMETIKKQNLEKENTLKDLSRYKELSVSFCKYAELANERFYSILYICKLFEKELTKVNQEQGREYSKILIENKYIREVLKSPYLNVEKYEKNDKFSSILKNTERKNKNSSFHIKKQSEIYNSNSNINSDSNINYSNCESIKHNNNSISSLSKQKQDEDYVIPEDINEEYDSKDNSDRTRKANNKSLYTNSKPKPKTIYLFYKTPREIKEN